MVMRKRSKMTRKRGKHDPLSCKCKACKCKACKCKVCNGRSRGKCKVCKGRSRGKCKACNRKTCKCKVCNNMRGGKRTCPNCKMSGGRKTYGLVIKDAAVPLLMVLANTKYPTLTKLRKTLRRAGIQFKNTTLRRSSFSTRRRKRRRGGKRRRRGGKRRRTARRRR